MSLRKTYKILDKCISCDLCYDVCPLDYCLFRDLQIPVKDGKTLKPVENYFIAFWVCNGCGGKPKCVKMCPQDAIVPRED